MWLLYLCVETLRIKLSFRICMLSGYPRARLCGRFSCDEFFYPLTFYVGGEKFLFRWSVVVGGHCANWRKCGSFAGGSYLLALGSAQKKARNAAPSFRRIIRLFMGSFKKCSLRRRRSIQNYPGPYSRCRGRFLRRCCRPSRLPQKTSKIFSRKQGCSQPEYIRRNCASSCRLTGAPLPQIYWRGRTRILSGTELKALLLL